MNVAGQTLSIAPRFNGPPGSGNGGYVCGRMAEHFGSSGVFVRLHRPPPLETLLTLQPTEAGLELLDGEDRVASARPTEIVWSPPEAPSFREACEASRAFRGFHEHVFPHCFVCGPERMPGDGLRVFPGPLDRDGLVACPWTPDASLASPDEDRVAPEFVWAALDCPGAFSFPQPTDRAVLLGEFGVALRGTLSVDEECVLVAWLIDHSGRKYRTGTAVYGADGSCRGTGVATWIEVAR